MRKFKVLHCKQEKQVKYHERIKTSEGAWITVAKFRMVKAGEEGWWPGAYGVEKIKAGDIIELGGRMADKASRNPQFEEVFEGVVDIEGPKRKPGRPKGSKNKAA